MERNDLAAFALDRFSLIFLALMPLFGFLSAGLRKNLYYFILLGLIGILIGFFIFLNKDRIIKTNLKWAGIGLAAGVVIVPALVIVEILSDYLTLFHDNVAPFPFGVLLLGRLFYYFSFTAPVEEIIFRGFLWGYLVKSGLSEQKAMWIQAIIFLFMHWDRMVYPLLFFIAVPVTTVIFTVLRKNSKQVFPSLLAHNMSNALTESILVFLRWHFYP